MAQQPPSFFPTTALVNLFPSFSHDGGVSTDSWTVCSLQDHAAAGLGAGVVAVMCMHPLDLLKVKFQVETGPAKGGIGKQIWYSLRDIQRQDGWKGLYRGIGPNIAGNASSWGFYFLL